MKKISLLAVFCALVSVAFAQLPDGSYAQDFHLFEINKTNGQLITTDTISLYEYTEAGKAVVMDVFATWCSPCWNYHNTGALEDLYNTYGPNGTDQVQVLFIEGSNGNYASLSGTGPDAQGQATAGNWLAGTPYPVIPLRMGANTSEYNSFHNNYAIAYFPTVYAVCPNRLVYEVGQISSGAGLYQQVEALCPEYDNTLMNNALIVTAPNFSPVYFCEMSATPVVKIQNVGDLNLTSATFTIVFDGQTTTYNWTGNLAKYATQEISLPQISASVGGNYTYAVTISEVNGVPDADQLSSTASSEFSIQVNGSTDPMDEDFEASADYLPDGWSMQNNLLGIYETSGSHGNAIFFNCYSYDNGVQEHFFLPMMNISAYNTPVLKFDVAYKRYNSSSNDRLKVMVSSDCGNTWSTPYNLAGANLSTASGFSQSAFIPSSDSQWRTEDVVLNNVSNPEDVIIKFNFTSNYGNIIWLDNVKIVDGTGVDEYAEGISIYPNPATSTLYVSSDSPVNSVMIYNLQGQLVKSENGNVMSVDVTNLAAGSYFVKVITENGTLNQKFIKE